MSRRYLDSSAAMKLVVREPESATLKELVDRWRSHDEVVISELVVTEMHRSAERLEVPSEKVTQVVVGLDVVEVTSAAFTLAGRLQGAHLRSLDALHIAVAIEVGTDTLVSYDERQAQAARDHGLRVEAPS